MALMRAYRLLEWGKAPEFVDVAVPEPGPGEVRLRMKGAGLCRSDLDLMEARAGEEPYATAVPAGFTLGHENAGLVDACGPGVLDLAEGDAVAVHHVHSCGFCDYCLEGAEQHCGTFARGAVTLTRGLGLDGGLAEYLVVPRRDVVPIGSLDPVSVAPLTDAGLAAYRAVQSVLHRLKPGSTAVVIGVGGLGSFGVQFLKLLSPATVIAVDRARDRQAYALELGADVAIDADDRAREQIMDLTRGAGADAIIDFVGSQGSLDLASAVSRPMGRIALVGMGGGTLRVGWGHMATGCEFAVSMGSTRKDLFDLCTLAATGRVRIDKETFALDAIDEAFARLRTGQLKGRAVICLD
ncbi:alcohol dehydrogenase [Sphingobium lactosutens]|uniref:NAD(P)-dependent alcohol dehydrogenase n=1 Tax=Sphingobium lactosutens TaxID=522773 RepID=UPI0015C19B54|nr:NAD(P)-dependent alcohol dehydrogenase [Sphingobium lactosutens]NWK94434.1 alcohol dehydrogenase [Sphingobium lactosutens]